MYGRLAGLFLLIMSFLFCERADLFDLASREHPIRVLYSTDDTVYYDASNDARFPDTPEMTGGSLFFKIENTSSISVDLVGTPSPGGPVLVFDDPVFGSSSLMALTLAPDTDTGSFSVSFTPPSVGDFNTLGTVPYQESGDSTIWVYSFRAGGTGI